MRGLDPRILATMHLNAPAHPGRFILAADIGCIADWPATQRHCDSSLQGALALV